MTNNTTVRDLKAKYDAIFSERIHQYLAKKGFEGKSIHSLTHSWRSKSFKVLVESRAVKLFKADQQLSLSENGDYLSGDVKYMIAWEAVSKDMMINYHCNGEALTKILIKLLTRNYIQVVIYLIQEIRDVVGKSSQLVNLLGRVLTDVVSEFYTFSMRFDAQSIHSTYQKLLGKSDSYINSATAQMQALSASSVILTQTINSLNNGQLDTASLDQVNAALGGSINQLNTTITNINAAIKADTTQNLQLLQQRFVTFMKYAQPLQCQIAQYQAGTHQAQGYKQFAYEIFRATTDAYITLLPSKPLKNFIAIDKPTLTVLFDKIKTSLQATIEYSTVATASAATTIADDGTGSGSGEGGAIDEGITNTNENAAVDNMTTTVDQLGRNQATLKQARQKYLQAYITFIDTEANQVPALYTAEAIQEKTLAMQTAAATDADERFGFIALTFNLLSYVQQISASLKPTYGEGQLTAEQVNQVRPKLLIQVNFSQDVLNTLDAPMSQQQRKDCYAALCTEIEEYKKFQAKIKASLQKYQMVPDKFNTIMGNLANIADALHSSREAIDQLKANTQTIQTTVNEQLAVVDKQAQYLSQTFANIKSCSEDITTIETAKMERLRTASPDLSDAETKAQFYVLNALAETQREAGINISKGIKSLRKRALNFVKMTAVMNYIVQHGLVGRASLKLHVINADTQAKQTVDYIGLVEQNPNEIITDYGKSVNDDAPAMLQYAYLKALRQEVGHHGREGKITLEIGGSRTQHFVFHKIFGNTTYMDFMLSYYYLQVIFPFMGSVSQEYQSYIQLLAIMERIFLTWIRIIQHHLSEGDHFKGMRQAYNQAMNQSMREMDRDHLRSQDHLTLAQTASRGFKRLFSGVAEIFTKDSTAAQVGKTFANYHVKADHVDQFYKLFAKNYQQQLANGCTVNLPLVLLVATDLSIKSVKNREVDLTKTLFAGALTGGIAYLIGVSKFKSVLVGLTASATYGLGSWVVNSFQNYIKNDPQRTAHLRAQGDGATTAATQVGGI